MQLSVNAIQTEARPLDMNRLDKDEKVRERVHCSGTTVNSTTIFDFVV